MLELLVTKSALHLMLAALMICNLPFPIHSYMTICIIWPMLRVKLKQWQHKQHYVNNWIGCTGSLTGHHLHVIYVFNCSDLAEYLQWNLTSNFSLLVDLVKSILNILGDYHKNALSKYLQQEVILNALILIF
jgi:hypothetical protein